MEDLPTFVCLGPDRQVKTTERYGQGVPPKRICSAHEISTEEADAVKAWLPGRTPVDYSTAHEVEQPDGALQSGTQHDCRKFVQPI